jgi:gamma-glutamylcyclotransferase (GGCT)/AIG2-like uncharacterized protein YtfP
MINHIAFYGTLKRGYKTHVHGVIERDLTYIGECLIPGNLYDLGRISGLKPGNRPISGELYKINKPKSLIKIDSYELHDNEDPSKPGFKRQALMLLEPKLKAWAYYYQGPVEEDKLIRANKW